MGINLKAVQSGAKAGARNAVVGGAGGYLSGANKAEQAGKGPTGQIGGGLKKGLSNAANRGSWAAKKAYWDEKNKNQQIPNQDLRTVGKVGSTIALNALKLAGPLGFAASTAISHRRTIIIAIIAILILFAYLAFQLSGGLLNPQPSPSQTSSTNPLQVFVTCNPSGTKDAPLQVGDTSVCTITVTDTESPNDITIIATVAPFAQYVTNSATYNGTTGGTYDATNDTVMWDAKKLGIPLTSPSFTLTLTVKLTQPYNGTQNAEGGPISVVATPVGGASGEGYVAPNDNNCNGQYTNITNNSFLPKNFGDPQCNFSKDQTYTDLQQQDPKDASVFFTIIIPCESSWIPNAWASPASGTPSSTGAWGLFQMGSSSPPGQPADNSIQDRGDVNWQLQIVSATNKAKTIPNLNYNDGGYWSGLDWTNHSAGKC